MKGLLAAKFTTTLETDVLLWRYKWEKSHCCGNVDWKLFLKCCKTLSCICLIST